MNDRWAAVIIAIFFCASAAVRPVFADDEAGNELTGSTTVNIIETSDSESPNIKNEAAAETDDEFAESAEIIAETITAESVDGPAAPKAKTKNKGDDGLAEPKAKDKIKIKADDESAIPKVKAKAKKAAADEPKGTQFKLSGVVETGFDINNRVNEDRTDKRMIARGELEISARPVKKVRAEIGIEYNHRDTFVTVDKFYGQYNVTKDGTVRAGIMKKSFGLEERAGVAERYFRSRSIVNSWLKDLGMERAGFLGHDLTLQYRHEYGKEWRFTGGLAWSAQDSLAYHQNYSAQYGKDNLLAILALITRHHAPAEGMTTTFASSLSMKYKMNALISEAEFTLGTHPFFRQVFYRDSYVYGFRLQESFPIAINTKTLRQIVPLAETALLCQDDTKRGSFDGPLSKQIDMQLRAGLTLGFAENSAFQWRNTFGTVLRAQDQTVWKTLNKDAEVRRYRYDTEVLVIF